MNSRTLLTALALAGPLLAAVRADNGLQTVATTTQTSPAFAVLGPDGNLWVTETGNNSIFRVAPDGTGLTRFGTGAATRPNSICVGGDGNLWFTSDNANFVGQITPAGGVTVFTGFGNAASRPMGICAGPDGALWAADLGGELILRIPTTGAPSTFAVPFGSDPTGICAGPDGALWFTAFGTNKIGRITTGGALSDFAIPTPDSGPQGICAGPFGTLCFTEAAASKIGILTTGGVFTEFALPAGSQPDQIVLGPDGVLWFTMIGTGRIGRMTFAGELVEFAASDPRSVPSGLAVGADRIFVVETVASAVRSARTDVPVVRLSAAAYRLGEKAGALTVPILRSGAPGATGQAHLTTSNGTAIAPGDYQAVSATVKIAAKKTQVTAKVPVVADAIMESDETFTIALTATDGSVLVTDPATATVTLVDSTAQTFPGFSGNYAGIIAPLSVPADAALLSIMLNTNATFTATLLTATGRFQLKGQLDAGGDFSGAIARGSLPPLTLTLHLDQTGSGSLTGTLTDGTATQPLAALHAVFNATTNPAPQAGRYTALLPAVQVPGEPAPAGVGFGTIVVDAAGKVRFAGTLGDGTKITTGAVLDGGGIWPFFATPYKPKGAVSGEVQFRNLASSDANGTLRWLRPANAKSALFPAGFVTTIAFSGGAFAVPAGTLILPFATTSPNGLVTFAGGDLGLALPDQAITVAADHKVTITGNAPFKLTFQTKTGLFSGSFRPAGAAKSRSFSGAVQQKLGAGQGLFSGETETGAVTVTP